MIGLLRDVVESWGRPGAVVRRKLARGTGEDTLLAYAVLAGFIAFAARVPGLIDIQRAAGADAPPLSTMVGASFVVYAMFAPLFMYLLAALSHLAARLLGGEGSWHGARLALFWGLLAVQPLVILSALANSLSPWPWFSQILSLAFAGMFFWVWLGGLMAAERVDEGAPGGLG